MTYLKALMSGLSQNHRVRCGNCIQILVHFLINTPKFSFSNGKNGNLGSNERVKFERLAKIGSLADYLFFMEFFMNFLTDTSHAELLSKTILFIIVCLTESNKGTIKGNYNLELEL